MPIHPVRKKAMNKTINWLVAPKCSFKSVMTIIKGTALNTSENRSINRSNFPP